MKPTAPQLLTATLCTALGLAAASCSSTQNPDGDSPGSGAEAEADAGTEENLAPDSDGENATAGEPDTGSEAATSGEETDSGEPDDQKKRSGFRWFRSPSAGGGESSPDPAEPDSADIPDASGQDGTDDPPRKRRGFFGLFSRKKDSGPDPGASDPEVAAGEQEPGGAVVQEIEIDKNAPVETQFLQACASAALGASGGTAAGRDGWYFDQEELDSLAGGAAPGRASVIAIAEYARQLRGEGVQLVVVPVPPKAVLYPDELTKDWKISGRNLSRLDQPLRTLYADLAARGVTVVDPGDAMIDQRDAKTGRMYPKTNSAWSPRAAELAAAQVAEKVRASGWLTDSLRKTGISTMEATLSLQGDLARGSAETVPARIVKMDGGTMDPTSSAPVLVLAGTDGLAYRESGASFADQLAAELRVAFDLVATEGNGRNIPRSRALQKSLSSPGYVTRRKCVVWLVGGEEFVDRDWRFVPVDLRLQQSEEDLRSSG